MYYCVCQKNKQAIKINKKIDLKENATLLMDLPKSNFEDCDIKNVDENARLGLVNGSQLAKMKKSTFLRYP